MYAFTLSCYKAGIRGIDLHLKARLTKRLRFLGRVAAAPSLVF